MTYIGIAVGVAAMAGAVVYGAANQQNYVSDDASLVPTAKQGSFTSESGLGTELKKDSIRILLHI